jgi:tetratricopeptide (TPR) repeat protein
MTAWREEIARHARLAADLRLPAFEWYTPLWSAVDAMLAGRAEEAERLSLAAREAGLRAGDRNAELLVDMVRFCDQAQREAYDEIALAFVRDKIVNSPAAIAYRGGHAWILAGLGETDAARQELHTTMGLTHAFDANWLSLQAELAEASVLIGDPTFAATLYERLTPYAGRPVTAGRANCSYGAVDHRLGRLAALLDRKPDAIRHLEDAIRLNDSFGCAVWRTRAQHDLTQIVRDEPLVG